MLEYSWTAGLLFSFFFFPSAGPNLPEEQSVNLYQLPEQIAAPDTQLLDGCDCSLTGRACVKHDHQISAFKRRKPLSGRAGDLRTLKTLVRNFIDAEPLIPDQDFDPGQAAQFSITQCFRFIRHPEFYSVREVNLPVAESIEVGSVGRCRSILIQ